MNENIEQFEELTDEELSNIDGGNFYDYIVTTFNEHLHF